MPTKKNKSSEKPIFKDCVIALAGDLNKEDWTDEQLQRWISLRQGIFIGRIDQAIQGAKVTHVLATPELYEKMSQKRKQSMKKEKLAIVHWDWLEDSIEQKKRLKESDFRLDRSEKEAAAKKKKEESKAKGIELVEKGGVNNNLNHPYTDTNFFKYDITLTKMNPDTGMVGELWKVRIWESAGKPKLYHCSAEYNKARGKKMHIRPGQSETPGSLEREMAAFKWFFACKTGICWHERLVKAEESKQDISTFTYEPPTGGKPVGDIELIERPLNLPAKDFEAARLKAAKNKSLSKRHLSFDKDSDQAPKLPKKPCPGIPARVEKEEQEPQFAQGLQDLLEASRQSSTKLEIKSRIPPGQISTSGTLNADSIVRKEEDEYEDMPAENLGEDGHRQVDDDDDDDTIMNDHIGDLRGSMEPDGLGADDEVEKTDIYNANTAGAGDTTATQDPDNDGCRLGRVDDDPTEDEKNNTNVNSPSDRDHETAECQAEARDDENDNDGEKGDANDSSDDEGNGENNHESENQDGAEEPPTRPTKGMKTPHPTIGTKTPRPANYLSQPTVHSQLAGGGEDYDATKWLDPHSDDNDNDNFSNVDDGRDHSEDNGPTAISTKGEGKDDDTTS